jgi:hypothetical protein
MNSTQNSHPLKASLLQYYYIYSINTPKKKEHVKKGEFINIENPDLSLFALVLL